MVFVFLFLTTSLSMTTYKFIHVTASCIVSFLFLTIGLLFLSVQFSSVQSLSRVRLFATP